MSIGQRNLTGTSINVIVAEQRLHQAIQTAIKKALGTISYHREEKLKAQGRDARAYRKYEQCETRSYAIGVFCTHLRSELSLASDEIFGHLANYDTFAKLFSPDFWAEIGVPRRYAPFPLILAPGWTLTLAAIRKMCDSPAPRAYGETQMTTHEQTPVSPQKISGLDEPTLDEKIKEDLKSLNGSISDLKVLLGRIDPPVAKLKATTVTVDSLLESA